MTYTTEIYPTIVFADATDILADMEALLKSCEETRIMAKTVIDKMYEHTI